MCIHRWNEFTFQSRFYSSSIDRPMRFVVYKCRHGINKNKHMIFFSNDIRRDFLFGNIRIEWRVLSMFTWLCKWPWQIMSLAWSSRNSLLDLHFFERLICFLLNRIIQTCNQVDKVLSIDFLQRKIPSLDKL